MGGSRGIAAISKKDYKSICFKTVGARKSMKAYFFLVFIPRAAGEWKHLGPASGKLSAVCLLTKEQLITQEDFLEKAGCDRNLFMTCYGECLNCYRQKNTMCATY